LTPGTACCVPTRKKPARRAGVDGRDRAKKLCRARYIVPLRRKNHNGRETPALRKPTADLRVSRDNSGRPRDDIAAWGVKRDPSTSSRGRKSRGESTSRATSLRMTADDTPREMGGSEAAVDAPRSKLRGRTAGASSQTPHQRGRRSRSKYGRHRSKNPRVDSHPRKNRGWGTRKFKFAPARRANAAGRSWERAGSDYRTRAEA
jgi:hypothetical protein